MGIGVVVIQCIDKVVDEANIVRGAITIIHFIEFSKAPSGDVFQAHFGALAEILNLFEQHAHLALPILARDVFQHLTRGRATTRCDTREGF